ncbi:HIR complex subunit [Bacidia gigantensis]|uniref:HIR complex subunit n=1 Tax=Bacidia gigantensis TaxID=2732470 RepID=UPI001D058F5F|nr:HIR complex subunit [Bacidia gigantensis]KAG8525606.1 HIR complex subunit [Bacidia gigantensis]
MKFIRPPWLTHSGEKKDFEVYSCNVSPDGSRLVTAAGDGYVRIWSTEAIYNAGDPTYTKPKQLASMSYHSGTIHTARFSSNGQYLASGADDKLVVVYRFDPHGKPQEAGFGSDDAPQVESWRVFRRLIGHDNDVQDLGWSFDSSIMVSVGLDSKVVVWSGYTFEKLKTLAAHQSQVKGVTFDPANKYFATASDDRTIKIWRFNPPTPNSTAHDQHNNFMLEKTILSPFVLSPLTTYFRRPAWSPDGAHVAAANSVNGPVSTVCIINRGPWDGEIHLVGHEGPTEICAFSPRLFTKSPTDTASPHTVVACSGQDKALSIWVTAKTRPLTIVQDVAGKSVVDLAWTPDGRTLFAASLDGTITAVIFEPDEIGYEMKVEQNEEALAKYGAGRRGAGILEGPEGLLLEEKSKEGEMRGVEGRMGALMGDAALGSNSSTLNGFPSNLTTNGVKDSQETNANTSQTSVQVTQSDKPKEDPTAAKLEQLKNRVTITKDGKKRIAPLLVSSAGSNESSLPQTRLMSTSGTQAATSDQPQTILDLSKPVDGLPQGGLAALLLGNKRKFAPMEGVEDDHIDKKLATARKDGAVPIVTNTATGLVPAKAQAAPAGPQATPDFIRPAVTNPSLTVSQVRLAVPKVRTHIVRSLGKEQAADVDDVEGSSRGQSQNLVFEARNATQQPAPNRDQEPCRITVTRRGQPIFQDFLPRSTLLVTGNNNYWAAACEDGSIYAWTPSGRRIFNALVLESQPVIFDCQNQYLLCLTAVGMCYVWDMNTLTSPHPPVSLAPILDIAIHSLQDHVTRAPAVTGARLNSEGRIIITLTNGEGFAYNPNMFVWQRLSELWWLVGSQYWNTTDSSVGNLQSTSAVGEDSKISAGVIPFLERSTTQATLARGRARMLQNIVSVLLSKEGFEGFESTVSIAHLENRIAAAMMLGAKADFQVYLYMYAKRIGAEGLRGKVEELLRILMGDVYEDEEVTDTDGATKQIGGDRHWENKSANLCGWPRQQLLREVVLILGKNRDLQRITVPYAKVLGITEEHVKASEDAMVS